MLPWQQFDVVRPILLHIGPASVHNILFIVWLAGLYLIYQTPSLGLDVSSFIAALSFASATRHSLNVGRSDKSDRALSTIL